MKQIPFHEASPPGILTDTYDVSVSQGQVVMELPQYVVVLLGQLPVQFLQLFGLSPYPQKDHSKVYGESQEQTKGQSQAQLTLCSDTDP